MSNKLDRDRYYALVYGDPIKKAYQDGIFFDGQGDALSSGRPAVKPEPKAQAESAPQVAKLVESENLIALKGMHITKLKPMAVKLAEATGTKTPKLSGKGLKARLVAYIAKHTE